MTVFFSLIAVLWNTPANSYAQSSAGDSPPDVGARAAIVIDYPSGRIMFAKNVHDELAPASTTKILTSILALEYGHLDDVVTIAPSDLVGESTMGLRDGEQQTLHNLLYGMLLPSGNDAAMAVARYLGSKAVGTDPAGTDPVARFAQMMNVRAQQLGLHDSHFVNPDGLDTDNHYSSAYDLASLSWYALHFPTFNEIVRTVNYTAPGHPLLNTNEMLTRYEGADGIKTGWTDAAGLCLVTSATRNGHRLVSVVLNAPHWYADSTALLDYGFAQLSSTPTDSGAEVLSVARRGTVSWLLVNAAPAPQMPAPAATAAPAITGQGGGPAQVGETESQAGVPSAPPQNREGPARQAILQPATVVLAARSQQFGPGSPLFIVFLGFAVLALGLLVLSSRLFGFPPRRLFALSSLPHLSLRQPPEPDMLTLAPVGQRSAASAPEKSPATIADVAEAPILGTTRTLGSARLKRREPNLLVSDDQIADHRIQRALALADAGRQGSSMSEFLLAIRCGKRIDVADLAGAHQMNASAFFALAGAQRAAGDVESARQTLVHGTLVLPHDRLLSLALKQLPVE